jgi:fatty acid desaturase
MPSPRLYPATRVALTIVLAAQAAAMFLLPQAVAIHSAWGLLLVPLASTHHTLWSLVHEAIHGTLATPSRLNERLGRLLAVLHGAPFAVLRLGHLLHHRHNRSAWMQPSATTRPGAARPRRRPATTLACGAAFTSRRWPPACCCSCPGLRPVLPPGSWQRPTPWLP